MPDTQTQTDNYTKLCELTSTEPLNQKMSLAQFTTKQEMAQSAPNERLAASLQVFIDMVAGEESVIKHIDKAAIDHYIGKIDSIISSQLDEIMHHEEVQKFESSWRGLKYIIDNTNFRSNIKVEILDVDKENMRMDLEDCSEITQSGLYKHIYTQEYDTPGGEPISSLISNYEFDSSTRDISLLTALSKVSAASHCPFIGAVGSKFFNKKSIDEVTRINDLRTYMDKVEYINWNSFREREDSRYVGLTLPRFLLRLPYGDQNPTKEFCYQEQVTGETSEKYLWGNASFSFAANMSRSFDKYGWTLNIRGPESGGKIEQLPLHQYDIGRGIQTKIPTETIIPETRELDYADLGFIPLSYYKNSDFACFFSASSTQKPQEFLDPDATSNSRINARLPYIYLSSRLGHYLKVIQRENIGTNKSRSELEDELNTWLKTLVTKMNNPKPEIIATHPLRDGQVIVEDIPDNPGFYKITMYVLPHFQIEGVDIKLSLVGKLPKSSKQKQ